MRTTDWPTSPDVLTDTSRCPSCFAVITEATCTTCGLALSDARLGEVLILGRRILADHSRRSALIAAVREDAAEAAARWEQGRRRAEELKAAMAAPVGADAAAPAAPRSTPTPAPPTPAKAPRPPRRRIPMPVILLIVGVSLVGVAAIFFLTLAWIVAGIAVRALIIGGITLATIAAASILRHRRLTATAEAIAVLGVILLGLDAWAVRANDLFGTGDSDPVVYAGFSVLAVGAVCRAWSWISKLRAPDLASLLALPTGLALVLGGSVDLPIVEAWTIGLLGAGVGGLAHTLPAPWSTARRDGGLERDVLAGSGVAALVAATVTGAAASLDEVAVPLWAVPTTAVLAAAYTRLLTTRTAGVRVHARFLAQVAATTGALAVASLGWQLALRGDDLVYSLLLGPVLPVAVVAVAAAASRRAPVLRPAAGAAGFTAVVSTLGALLVWLTLAGEAAAPSWTAWTTAAFPAPPEGWWMPPVAALAIIALLATVRWLDQPTRREVRLAASGALLLAAVSCTASPVLLVATAIILLAAAVAALRLPTTRWVSPTGAVAVAIIGAATAYGVGTTISWLWFVAAGAAIAAPLTAALILRPAERTRAHLALVSVGVASAATLSAPYALAAMIGTDAADPRATFALLQWLAIAVLTTAAFARLAPAVTRALAGTGISLLAVSLLTVPLDAIPGSGIAAAGAVSRLLGEPWSGLGRAVVGIAIVGLIAFGRTRVTGRVRPISAALLAPIAGAAIISACTGFDVDEYAPTIATTVFATLCVASALLHVRSDRPDARLVRVCTDGGALVSTAVVAWQAPRSWAWVVLLLIAIAFAATSATRGWAAPRSARVSGIPTFRADGVRVARAPRRLLVWLATVAAAFALWAWLDQTDRTPQIEAYVLPAAGAFAILATAFTWLRRHPEAAVATGLASVLGLGILGADARSAGDDAKAMVVSVAASVFLLLLSLPRVRRLVAVTLAGALTALPALAYTVAGLRDEPWQIAWLLLPVAVALATAAGLARTGAVAHRLFAVAIPSLVLAWATIEASVRLGDSGWVVAGAMTVLLGLHLVASAWDALPFGSVLRWTSLAGALLIAGTAIPLVDGAVELLSLPTAAALLGGSALAMRRLASAEQRWYDLEALPWLGGLVLAVAPSLGAPIEGPRVWLTLVACLLAGAALPFAATARTSLLASASASLLFAAAAVVGVRALLEPTGWAALLPALVAGAGVVAGGAVLIWTGVAWHQRSGPAFAGLGIALVAVAVILRGDAGLAFSVVTTVLAAVIAIGAAAALGEPVWRRFAAVVACGATIVALVVIGARFLLVADPVTNGLEPDVWAVSAVGIVVAVGVMALRSGGTAAIRAASSVAFPLAVILFGAAEGWLLWSGPESSEVIRTVIVMSALSAAGVVGAVLRPWIGTALAWTAALAAVGVGVTAVVVVGLHQVEAVTVAPALGLFVLGARRLARDPEARSWPTLGAGLALLLIPSLLLDLGPAELWRIVGLGVVAIAVVVVGAVRRLQAPLLLGSVVLLIHAGAQLWPWISSAYVSVPWWLWLGIGGVLLIVLAARYEKQVRALRTAYTAVTSLR